MSKEFIPIDIVTKDLIRIFELDNSISSTESNGRFMIDKNHFSRFEVIEKLQNYFATKNIEGGYLKLDNITFVHTSFEILTGKP